MEENKDLTLISVMEQEDRNSFDFQTILKTIVLNLQWFLLSLIICLGLAAIYLRYTTPVYQVYTKLLIKDDENSNNRGRNSIMNSETLGLLSNSAGIDNGHQDVQSGVGRLGAVNWMWQRLEKMDKSTLFGSGLEYMIYADHEDYSNQSYYQGIRSRGSITGIVNTFMTIGLIGVILYILFVLALLLQNRSRIGRILMIVALFDYVFYNAMILTSSSLLTLTLFLSILSEEEEKKERMEEAICPSL